MRKRIVVSFAIGVCGLAFTTALIAAANQSTATVVTTREGREIKGTTVTEDTFVVHIRDDRGQIHVFDKVTRTVVVVPAAGISYERLVKAGAEPHNWLMYWGDYQGTHYSALKQIDDHQRRAAAGGVDVADARRRRAPGHAARRRRRDVHDAAWRRRRARRANRPRRSGDTRGSRR